MNSPSFMAAPPPSALGSCSLPERRQPTPRGSVRHLPNGVSARQAARYLRVQQEQRQEGDGAYGLDRGPCCTAQAATCARVWKSSLARMCLTCTAAVPSLITSAAAIWRLVS